MCGSTMRCGPQARCWPRSRSAASSAACCLARGPLPQSREQAAPALPARPPLGLATLAAAGLYPPLVAVAAPLAGLSLGPSLATLFGLASSAAPEGGGTEAQSWLSSVMNGGAAAGAALAGATAGRPVFSLAIPAPAAAASSAVSLALSTKRPGGTSG